MFELQEGDIRVVKITDDTISLQGRSLERLKYEIEYGLKRGTTDNSYLVKGQTHTALIDIPDQAFSKAFLETLANTTDLKRLTYLILGHFSPKRVESLVGLADALAERDDPLQVYCSNPAAQQLKSVVPSDLLEKRFIITVVKADDNLDLGGGQAWSNWTALSLD
jgi:flavorubredoxin